MTALPTNQSLPGNPTSVIGPTAVYSTSDGTKVSDNVKNAAGTLFAIYATNINAAIRYLQLFNKATGPADEDIPALTFEIPAGTSTLPTVLALGQDWFGFAGQNFNLGISFGFSTDGLDYNAATASDHTFAARYS